MGLLFLPLLLVGFCVLNSMAKIKSTQETSIKNLLIDAFDKSESKSVLDICRIVDINPRTFYYHTAKDKKFKRQITQKRQTHLINQLSKIV